MLKSWINNLIILQLLRDETRGSHPKGIEEEEEAPGNDDVVVEPNEESNDRTRNSNSTDSRMNHIPGPKGPSPESLPNSELN